MNKKECYAKSLDLFLRFKEDFSKLENELEKMCGKHILEICKYGNLAFQRKNLLYGKDSDKEHPLCEAYIHILPDLNKPYSFNILQNILVIRVGTCYALIQIPVADELVKKNNISIIEYIQESKTLMVISVYNYEKGNGDFCVFLELIHMIAKSYRAKYLSFSEIRNKQLHKHLVKKRGFSDSGKNWVIKEIKN